MGRFKNGLVSSTIREGAGEDWLVPAEAFKSFCRTWFREETDLTGVELFEPPAPPEGALSKLAGTDLPAGVDDPLAGELPAELDITGAFDAVAGAGCTWNINRIENHGHTFVARRSSDPMRRFTLCISFIE